MSSPRRGTAGFTLLEVLIATVVLALAMGGLITMVQRSLASLARVRVESDASRLAEAQLRRVLTDLEIAEEPLEMGHDEGRYEPPNDELLWELTIDSFGLVVPDELQEYADTSSIFQSPEAGPRAPEPSLRRVTLRVRRDGDEQDLIDPFVVFLVEPLAEVDLEELVSRVGEIQ